MACTRGGKAKAVPPPRIFTTSAGIKVRKVNGGHVYQPAPLKVSCYLTLDKNQVAIDGQPNWKLYENVQKFIDKIIDQVEDRILRLPEQGTHTFLINQSGYHCSVRMGFQMIDLTLFFHRTCDG